MADSTHSSRLRDNRNWLIVSACLLVLLASGLIYAVRQHASLTSVKVMPTAASALTPAQYTQRITHPDVVVKLSIADGKTLKTGPSKIIVKLGQSVNVNIYATGEGVTVNLKGYNINTEAAPEAGAEGGFHFVADKAGTFPYYVVNDKDSSTHQIGTIVVQ